MAEPDVTGDVRYSAKELFAQIKADIKEVGEEIKELRDIVTEKLDSKADQADLSAIESRVAILETREAERRGFGFGQKAILGALVLIAGLLIPIVLHYLP